jgi:hypothetical protein
MKHLLVWLKRSSSFIKKIMKNGFGFLIFVTLTAIIDKFVMDYLVIALSNLESV